MSILKIADKLLFVKITFCTEEYDVILRKISSSEVHFYSEEIELVSKAKKCEK